jgi:hypothetical protein
MMEVEFLLPSGGCGRSRMPRHARLGPVVAVGGGRMTVGWRDPQCTFVALHLSFISLLQKKPFTASSASSFTVIPSPPPQSLLCALTSRISASLSHDIHIDVPSLSVLEQSCTAKIPNGVALHAIIQSYCEARCRWSQERYKFQHLGRRA